MVYLYTTVASIFTVIFSLVVFHEGGLFFAILIFLLAIIPAKIAEKKGYDFVQWWAYGSALWIIAFIHSLSLSDKTRDDVGKMKKCPQCAESIKNEALKCRYCGSELSV